MRGDKVKLYRYDLENEETKIECRNEFISSIKDRNISINDKNYGKIRNVKFIDDLIINIEIYDNCGITVWLIDRKILIPYNSIVVEDETLIIPSIAGSSDEVYDHVSVSILDEEDETVDIKVDYNSSTEGDNEILELLKEYTKG